MFLEEARWIGAWALEACMNCVRVSLTYVYID
jgi:hypothetical protein